MSADEFGVMRMSGLTLQEANDAFELRPAADLEACLRELVTVKLLNVFDHQHRAYLFQWDWQDWQKIVYPRKTLQPKPPVAPCSRNTQWLLSHWPGGGNIKSWQAPETFTHEDIADFPKPSEIVPKDLSVPLAVSRSSLAVSVSREPSPPPPRTSAPIFAQSEHRNHACCGVVCLHSSLFSEFVRKSRHEADPDTYVRDFFAAWNERYQHRDRAKDTIGEDQFDFWRKRWAESHPPTVSQVNTSGQKTAAAAGRVAQLLREGK
jgi:hypothetical protein